MDLRVITTVFALACLFGGCALYPGTRSQIYRGDSSAVFARGGVRDSTKRRTDALYDSPALSSTAQLPNPRNTGQLAPLELPGAMDVPRDDLSSGGSHPLVGIVPGGSHFP